ncbi:MAG: ATP-dependent DNA helicase, partial [Alistipes sp.]|nr:ATP-dependent DNA helicase [Alistipes sp.]
GKPAAPPRSTEGMRSMGARRVEQSEGGTASAAPVGACPYAVGDRVEHPKFNAGVVVRIETLAADHKVVVDFAEFGEKTLLAKFAKLKKL